MTLHMLILEGCAKLCCLQLSARQTLLCPRDGESKVILAYNARALRKGGRPPNWGIRGDLVKTQSKTGRLRNPKFSDSSTLSHVTVLYL